MLIVSDLSSKSRRVRMIGPFTSNCFDMRRGGERRFEPYGEKRILRREDTVLIGEYPKGAA